MPFDRLAVNIPENPQWVHPLQVLDQAGKSTESAMGVNTQLKKIILFFGPLKALVPFQSVRFCSGRALSCLKQAAREVVPSMLAAEYQHVT